MRLVLLLAAWMFFGQLPPIVSEVPPSEQESSDAIAGMASFLNPKDGQQMMLVPQGAFVMGADPSWRQAGEFLPSQVVLPSYYMGKTEVTVGQYKQFVQETGYKAEGPWHTTARADNFPVTNVTWRDAMAYCQWAGLRLPTEAEWEKAARGTDGRVYPWGNWWEPRAVATDGISEQVYSLLPVGKIPRGRSPYGCLDMVSNAWEWTLTPFDAAAELGEPAGSRPDLSRIVRGVGWSGRAVQPARARVTYRFALDPTSRGSKVGFRCVADGIRFLVKLKDTDILTTLQSLFDAAGQSYEIPGGIVKSVSVDLVGVTLETALKAILEPELGCAKNADGSCRIFSVEEEFLNRIAEGDALADGHLLAGKAAMDSAAKARDCFINKKVKIGNILMVHDPKSALEKYALAINVAQDVGIKERDAVLTVSRMRYDLALHYVKIGRKDDAVRVLQTLVSRALESDAEFERTDAILRRMIVEAPHESVKARREWLRAPLLRDLCNAAQRELRRLQER